MHTRNRVWSIGLIGQEKFQREIIKVISNRNLNDKEKILRKMDKNPSNYVMNNLSNGQEPVLSIIKTPGNTRFIRNILTGCFLSDYLVFLIDCTSSASIFSDIERYQVWQIARYFKKQVAFIFLDEKFEEFKHSKLQDGVSYNHEEQMDIKMEVKSYLESKRASVNPVYLFLKNKDEDNILWDFLFETLLNFKVEVDPYPTPVIWPKSSKVYEQLNRQQGVDQNAMDQEIKNLDKFNVIKSEINIIPPTHFQVLRAYKNYESNRLILFAKILSGEITAYSNQSYMLTGAYDGYYRFDSLQIGGKSLEKVVKGELAALSFIDRTTYPFFIKRALGGQRHEIKRWMSAEEGVISAKVNIFLFEKTDFDFIGQQRLEQEGMEEREDVVLGLGREVKKIRQNLGVERKFRAGSQFTMVYAAQKKGITVLDVLQEAGNGEWTLLIETRSITLETFNRSEDLGKFAMLEAVSLECLRTAFVYQYLGLSTTARPFQIAFVSYCKHDEHGFHRHRPRHERFESSRVNPERTQHRRSQRDLRLADTASRLD